MENPVTSDNPVAYERAGNIARITLRRPPVNALSLEVIRAVREARQDSPEGARSYPSCA